MKYLAAYLLLALAGNEAPSSADIKAVLSSVGIDAEADRLDKVISELQGKDLQEVSDTRTRISNLNCMLTLYVADLRGLCQARFRPLRRWWWCCCPCRCRCRWCRRSR